MDLFADHSLLLEGLDLVTALASYYYLAFVFQLHYAKEVGTKQLMSRYIDSEIQNFIFSVLKCRPHHPGEGGQVR